MELSKNRRGEEPRARQTTSGQASANGQMNKGHENAGGETNVRRDAMLQNVTYNGNTCESVGQLNSILVGNTKNEKGIEWVSEASWKSRSVRS